MSEKENPYIGLVIPELMAKDPDDFTPEEYELARRIAFHAGGSIKSKYPIDSQQICREVRGKE